MDKRYRSPGARCRALAHALKRLFKTIKAQNPGKSLDAPVELIRKDLSRASYLQNISQASFPEFECPNTDCGAGDDLTLSLPMPFGASISTQESQKTLLPARSLSHFNLHQVYTGYPESSVLGTRNGGEFRPIEVSGHASTGKVQSHKPVLVSKKSTLQIRRPESGHGIISNASLAASFPSDSISTAVIRRTRGSYNLRKYARADASSAEIPSLTSIAEQSCTSGSRSSVDDSLHLVRHFASFCIIDIVAPGCPVCAVSEDLRYLYDIKDRFVLNAQECSQLSMDLSVGRDPAGNEVTYVLLYGPLVSPTTTKTRFILVSAIDISGYIHYAATLDPPPEPSQGCESPKSLMERPSPRRKSCSVAWIDEEIDHIADELLHGFSTSHTADWESTIGRQPSGAAELSSPGHDEEDIWTAIAREEGLLSYKVSEASSVDPDTYGASVPGSSVKDEATVSSKQRPTLQFADESVIKKFIEGLQVLYSQYFLLACSPVNGQFYEICYVSPAVDESGDYVNGHLSHMPFNLINDLGAQLAAGSRFRTTVRWGNGGVEKQLYCIPLLGPQPAPWICMLVDKEMPIHW